MTKSAQIHQLDGTYDSSRHADRLAREQNNSAVMPESRPVKPAVLSQRGSEVWDQYVRLLPWLTEADSSALAQFAGLVAEWEKDPEAFSASKMAQQRKIESELGMTLISRGKFDAGKLAGNSFFDD